MEYRWSRLSCYERFVARARTHARTRAHARTHARTRAHTQLKRVSVSPQGSVVVAKLEGVNSGELAKLVDVLSRDSVAADAQQVLR